MEELKQISESQPSLGDMERMQSEYETRIATIERQVYSLESEKSELLAECEREKTRLTSESEKDTRQLNEKIAQYHERLSKAVGEMGTMQERLEKAGEETRELKRLCDERALECERVRRQLTDEFAAKEARMVSDKQASIEAERAECARQLANSRIDMDSMSSKV